MKTEIFVKEIRWDFEDIASSGSSMISRIRRGTTVCADVFTRAGTMSVEVCVPSAVGNDPEKVVRRMLQESALGLIDT